MVKDGDCRTAMCCKCSYAASIVRMRKENDVIRRQQSCYSRLDIRMNHGTWSTLLRGSCYLSSDS